MQQTDQNSKQMLVIISRKARDNRSRLANESRLALALLGSDWMQKLAGVFEANHVA